MEPLTQAQARQYSPMALAFLGDSVYEVMVREYLLRQANQPAAAERLLPHLTEDEAGVYKRGRNANNTVPRHTSAQDYHRATGLESLFGYLHLTGAGERLEELFEIVMHTGETPAEE